MELTDRSPAMYWLSVSMAPTVGRRVEVICSIAEGLVADKLLPYRASCVFTETIVIWIGQPELNCK